MRALIERLRSPARNALSDAGPPDRWVFAGFGLAVLFIAVGWFSGVLRDVPWPLWALIPVAILTVVGLADRDGWNIRRAMAYVAITHGRDGWAERSRGVPQRRRRGSTIRTRRPLRAISDAFWSGPGRHDSDRPGPALKGGFPWLTRSSNLRQHRPFVRPGS